MRKIRIVFLLLLVLGAGAGYALLRYFTGDRFLRETILAKLAEHYSQFDISIGRARLDLPNGLLYLDRLAFASREAAADGPLVTVPEIEIRVDPQEFRRGKFKVRQITLNHPRLRAGRLPDGRWDVSDLLPLPRFSDSPPEVLIRGGTIELHDEQGPSPRKLVLRDVHLRFIPDSEGRFDFSGSFRGEHLSLAHLEGHFDADRQEWLVAGLIEKLSLGSPLIEDLPAPLAEKLEPLRGITAPVEVHYRLAQAGPEEPIRFECEAVLESGRLEAPGLPLSLKTLTAGSVLYRDGLIKCELRGRDGILLDSRLPFDLHDVTASISIAGDRIEGRLTGRNGVTEVQVDLAFEQGDLTQPTRITGQVTQLSLDNRVYTKLTPELRAIWDRFSPAGEANLSFRFSREENTWHRQVVLTCLGGAFQFDKFPYPLTEVTGTIRDEQDRIDVDLHARAGSRPVTVKARIEHPGPEAKISVKIAGNQIPIDRKLLGALPQPSRDVIGRMNPKGFVDFRAVFWRVPGEAKTFRRSLNLTLRDCSVQHEKFPYLLSQITGTITEKNRSWRFHELRGYNDTAVVVANGTLEPPERGGRFNLQLTGSEVPFEDELRAALPPQWASVWEQCAPKGTADFVAQLQYRPDRSFRITNVALRLDGASVRLRAFPYRWDHVKANLDIEDGQVVIRDLTAQHEGVQLRANGRVLPVSSGGYVIRLEGLDVENLPIDRTLRGALPDRLANLTEHLELEGPVDLQDTTFEFYWSGRRGDSVHAKWNVGVQLSDNSFRCGQRFEHVNGLIEIEGKYDGKGTQGHGKFDLGSLSLMGVQLTKITGPFRWAGNDLIFGSGVHRAGPRRPAGQGQEHLHARLLGGTITADVVVRGDPALYWLNASLRGARLERYAKEYMPDRQRLGGDLSGHLRLSGRVEGSVRPKGHGAFRIKQGDLYELPLVLALLKIPSLQFPDNTAFTEAEAEFRFTADKIDIKSIRLFGDAVTLTGRGKVFYDRKIDLTFYTMVGRDTVRIPLLTDLFRGASEQLFAIHVTGRFENPRASPEIIPQVTDAMRQFLRVRRTR